MEWEGREPSAPRGAADGEEPDRGNLARLRALAAHVGLYVRALTKWMVLAILVGIVCGGVGTAFHVGIDQATALRGRFPWLLACLPLAGLAIVGFYKLTRTEGQGTNNIIDEVHAGTGLSIWLLPAICLSFGSLAVISRMTRSNMIEVLNLDYIRTARSKGIKERQVVGKHGLRNILVPVMTVIGAQLGGLIGNAVVVETIFNWPGVGSYITQSILQTDYAPVQAFTVVSVLIYMAINLILDILYAVVDPRITYN